MRLRLRVALLCLLWPLAAPAALGPVRADGRIEVLFAPHDPVEARLIALIGQARRSVRVQSYIFTRKPVAEALVAARGRGVDVQVLADARMNQRGKNALPLLLAAGVPVALETAYSAAHNKVILIDADETQSVVITGSYNFTWSAGRKNAENVMVVYGHREVALAYRDNWRRHWQAATPVGRLPVKLVN
ncbi:phospholipase D family nuclease [Denitromonas ohlonensis]|uniref:phospholipase D n=2 Tax=Denitromonas TaxID=139331 RepID=A0A558EZ48_9RHOO|nr:phospholipase D family protein [Denitromonas ohlonensis]TVT49115.1 MAG: phospholipase D family protein [Denitromonas halophila]TVO69057.1 phospholipase D family protein [Denitromonas ohlonensis]TVO77157.1 phospholipase D family protein [Denitromonas ohlonensis]TVT73329.1 MAG: phospholipase D family protein [Denitromonas halophila]TVT78219.1 MAG: phospholipase D family protein [Denitromonas halophila]